MRRFACVVALTASACLVGACADRVATPDAGATTATATPEEGLDARGVIACSILKGSDLSEVGLDPATSQDRSNAVATACSWDSADRAETATVVVNPSFDIDLVATMSDEVQEFEVSGQRAVKEEPAGSRICTIYAELGQNQMVSAEFASRVTDRPVRSCANAERLVGNVINAVAARG